MATEVKQATKLCLWCTHFVYESSESDWSEVTIGASGVMECSKSHWDIGKDKGCNQEDFRQTMLLADICLDYNQVTIT